MPGSSVPRAVEREGQPSTALEPSVTNHLQRPKRPAIDSSTILLFHGGETHPKKPAQLPGRFLMKSCDVETNVRSRYGLRRQASGDW